MSATLLNARYLIQSIVSSSAPSYRVNGLFYDSSNIWAVADVAVNDEVFDFDAKRYRITAIHTQTGGQLEVTLLDLDGANLAPTLDSGVVYRPTANFQFPISNTEQNGITEYLKEFIRNNSIIKIDEELSKKTTTIIETLTLNATNIGNGWLTLTYTPDVTKGISLVVSSGPPQEYSVDYVYTAPNKITWLGEFATLLEAGDVLIISYNKA